MSDAGLLIVTALWWEQRAVLWGLPGAWVVRSGMGPRKAQRAAARLATSGARAYAVAGVCGALAPELVPGDVVVATQLQAPGIHLELEPAEPLVAALSERGVRVFQGPIIGTDRIVRVPGRDALRGGGAIAVDMETPWLASMAHGRPFAVLRVVSDGPGHEILRPSILRDGLRALQVLARSAPALVSWFEQVAAPPVGHPAQEVH